MKAYRTIRFTEFPDVQDIRREGRKSRVGSIGQHGYLRSAEAKKKIRRHLKRRDKARSAKLEDFSLDK